MTNEEVDDDVVEIYCFPLTKRFTFTVLFPFRGRRRILVTLHWMKAESLIEYTDTGAVWMYILTRWSGLGCFRPRIFAGPGDMSKPAQVR